MPSHCPENMPYECPPPCLCLCSHLSHLFILPHLETFSFFPDSLSLFILLNYLMLSFSVMPCQVTAAYSNYS